MKEIGPRIRKLREDKGLSLRELGDRINISFTHLSRIERGEKIPNLELLNTLANVFDVDMSYFFGEKQQVPEEFKDKVEWITFGEEMEKRNVSPEQLKELVAAFMKIKFGGDKN